MSKDVSANLPVESGVAELKVKQGVPSVEFDIILYNPVVVSCFL